MRPLRRRAAALTAAALVTTGLAVLAEPRRDGTNLRAPVTAPARPPPVPAAGPDRLLAGAGTGYWAGYGVGVGTGDVDQDPDRAPAHDRLRASCRTHVQGSRATAHCHNPNPDTDRVRLHVECARWWDVDADTAPVEIAPAGYVRLTERCWKEIRSVWVSHERVRPVRPGS